MIRNKYIRMLGWLFIITSTTLLHTCRETDNLSVRIVSPTDGDKFMEGEAINFYGEVSTYVGLQTYLYWEWSSNIDSIFGTSFEVTIDTLSIGIHRINFEAGSSKDDEENDLDIITIEIIKAKEDVSFTYTDLFPTENKVTVDASASVGVKEYYWKLSAEFSGYGFILIQESDTLEVPEYFFEELEPITGKFQIELTAIDDLGQTTIVQKEFERKVSKK